MEMSITLKKREQDILRMVSEAETEQSAQPMEYFIGSENGSGITAHSASEFIEYILGEIRAAQERGQNHFSITIEPED